MTCRWNARFVPRKSRHFSEGAEHVKTKKADAPCKIDAEVVSPFVIKMRIFYRRPCFARISMTAAGWLVVISSPPFA